MGNLSLEYFFEGNVKGNPFRECFFEGYSREKLLPGYFFEGGGKGNPFRRYFFDE